jgi:hypothetical protein
MIVCAVLADLFGPFTAFPVNILEHIFSLIIPPSSQSSTTNPTTAYPLIRSPVLQHTGDQFANGKEAESSRKVQKGSNLQERKNVSTSGRKQQQNGGSSINNNKL